MVRILFIIIVHSLLCFFSAFLTNPVVNIFRVNFEIRIVKMKTLIKTNSCFKNLHFVFFSDLFKYPSSKKKGSIGENQFLELYVLIIVFFCISLLA